MRLIADIETDGLLDTVTKIHCIAVVDADNPTQTAVFSKDAVVDGIALLQKADELIFHNGTTFDVPCLKQLYPNFKTDDITLTDTLVLSRMIKSDLKKDDFEGCVPLLPKRLHGSHSLKAWGIRLGVHKGDFSHEDTDWSVWTQEMADYCLQDAKVTHALWQALAPWDWSQEAVRFEHEIAELCERIGRAGWTFDMDKAAELYGKLVAERSALDLELQTLFPPWYIEEVFIPKVNNKTRGYVKGEPFIKKTEVHFNPNSRKHIERCLKDKYDWKPKVFTQSGDAKVDETTLSALPYPEAQRLARSFLIQKRIGMLAEGNAAWLKLVDADGKLRHNINSLGTISGRCSSFGPNLQQVPAVRAEFGAECRELFTVPAGYKLVGADLSGIELRLLASFLPDGGAYANELLNGDIHTANMHSMGLTDRNQAKTAIYCLIYGGGDKRLGEAIGRGPAEGKALRERFYKANPAFATLLRQIKDVVTQRGHLKGLDGRQLTVRGHAQLNLLLQSGAALVAKKWVQLVDQEIQAQGLDATIIAFVHDEIQVQMKGEPDHVGNLIRRSAERAGEAFKLKVPIEAEYSVGRTWAETH